MEGAFATSAVEPPYRRNRRYAYVAAVAALWILSHAGNKCIAVNATGDSPAPQPPATIAASAEAAADLKPSAPILKERGEHAASPLLIADARLARPPAARSAFRFDPSLDAEANDKATTTLSSRSLMLHTRSIGDDSLHLHLPVHDFEDVGPGTIKLSMAGLDVDSDRSFAGARAQLVAADDERGRMVLESRTAWLFEYLQTDSTAAAFFAPGDKGIFAVQGLGYGSNWITLGGGLRWTLVDGWSAHAGYDAQVNGQQLFHIGSAGFVYTW
jgi:hypothetical protein